MLCLYSFTFAEIDLCGGVVGKLVSIVFTYSYIFAAAAGSDFCGDDEYVICSDIIHINLRWWWNVSFKENMCKE